MPLVKNAAGKWVQSDTAAPPQSVRLVIIDKQVDENGSFQKSLAADVSTPQNHTSPDQTYTLTRH